MAKSHIDPATASFRTSGDTVVWQGLVLMSETMMESQSQTWFLTDLSSTTLQNGSCQRHPKTQPQDITLHNIGGVRRLYAISFDYCAFLLMARKQQALWVRTLSIKVDVGFLEIQLVKT